MEQPHIMRQRITDKELTLVCSLVTKIPDYQPLEHPTENEKKFGYFQKGSNKEVPNDLHTLNQVKNYEWKILTAAHWEKVNSSNGYMGIILVNESEKLLLLAHRGMQTDSIPNIANCLNIALNRRVPIIRDALKMCTIALDFIDNRYHGFTLCHTGFSMGGFLAQITAGWCNDKFDMHNQAICYDSPGAEHAINNFEKQKDSKITRIKLKDNHSNIIIYLTSPNLVNTGKAHYGDVRQIAKWKDKNEYESTFRKLMVEKAHIVWVDNLMTGENMRFAKSTIDSHLHLFNKDFSPFNAQNNFDFFNVEIWPEAKNDFTPKADVLDNKASLPNIQPSNSSEAGALFFKHIADVSAAYYMNKISIASGMGFIESISHQIVNPAIVYSDKIFLQGVVPTKLQKKEVSEKFNDSTISFESPLSQSKKFYVDQSILSLLVSAILYARPGSNPNQDIVEVIFNDHTLANKFSLQLLKVYQIGEPGMPSEQRVVNMLSSQNDETFMVRLTADEFNKIHDDDNAFANLLSQSSSVQKKMF
jgi:hypothetical protein